MPLLIVIKLYQPSHHRAAQTTKQSARLCSFVTMVTGHCILLITLECILLYFKKKHLEQSKIIVDEYYEQDIRFR